MCNCKVTELIVGIVVLVLALWPSLIGIVATKWVLVVAGVLLIIHGLLCKDLACSAPATAKAKPKKRKKKRK